MKNLKNLILTTKVLLIFSLFIIIACNPTTVRTSQYTTHQKYLSVWNNRLEQYKNEFIARDKIIQERVKGGALDILMVNSENPWETFINYVFELSGMIKDAYIIAGRGETIKAFIQHMKTHPSPGLTNVWFMQQADDFNKRAKEVDAKTQEFFTQKASLDAEWMSELEQIAITQGIMQGIGEELQSLYEQANSYYKDIERAKIDDLYRAEQQLRAAQALMNIGMYLNQLNYQQRLLNTLNKPQTCSFIGNTISCY